MKVVSTPSTFRVTWGTMPDMVTGSSATLPTWQLVAA
jgi:hypothetical protein